MYWKIFFKLPQESIPELHNGGRPVANFRRCIAIKWSYLDQILTI